MQLAFAEPTTFAAPALFLRSLSGILTLAAFLGDPVVRAAVRHHCRAATRPQRASSEIGKQLEAARPGLACTSLAMYICRDGFRIDEEYETAYQVLRHY